MRRMKSSFKKGNLFKTSIFIILGIFILIPKVSWGSSHDPETGIEFIIPDENPVNEIQTFRGFVRYPAETRVWTKMTNNTAYFRDVNVGGNALIYGTTHGETWHAEAYTPFGGIVWGKITFFFDVNKGQWCFELPNGQTICNTSSLDVIWYKKSKCLDTGWWTMRFYHNNIPFHSGQFITLPEIPPDAMPTYFSQMDYDDMLNPDHLFDSTCYFWLADLFFGHGNLSCYPPSFLHPLQSQYPSIDTGVPYTIADMGCYLVSATMFLNYHGFDVDPISLNQWFITNEGYTGGGGLIPTAIPRYANSQIPEYMSYLENEYIADSDPYKFEKLERAICQYGPQIIAVNHSDYSGHFILAYGRDAEKTTFKILDPLDINTTTLSDPVYGNQFIDSRIMAGPEYTYTDTSGIEIHFHSPGELLITDPQGRRTGLDPINGLSYREIPNSSYSLIRIDNPNSDTPPVKSKVIHITQASDGEYKIDVIGTGEGYYILDINVYDSELNSSSADFELIPISPGLTQSYLFKYSKSVGSGLDVYGLFDGKGQRPRDVNKFLSYSNPTQVTTTLPMGTSTFSLMIFYDNAIIPGTFIAKLNGQDASSLFTPLPGTNQIVNLSLQNGRNVLKLSVDGNLSKRIATDTDRLVFIVK